jgi:hypothetical protein
LRTALGYLFYAEKLNDLNEQKKTAVISMSIDGLLLTTKQIMLLTKLQKCE